MPKPIRKTPEIIASLMKTFTEELSKIEMCDGKITITKTFEWKNDKSRAIVKFTPLAWTKMLTVLQGFDSEIGWHSVVDRVDQHTFLISDLLFYPQVVTAATVNTDEDEWHQWEITPEYNAVCNRLLAHGHSHVNMKCFPSGDDDAHWNKLIMNTRDNCPFYIFMIWNKKLEYFIKVYDYENNTLYETGDVDIQVDGMTFDQDAFIKMCHERVKRKTYTPNYASGYGGTGYTTGQLAGLKEKYSGDKTGKANKVDDDDDDDGYGFDGYRYDPQTGTYRLIGEKKK